MLYKGVGDLSGQHWYRLQRGAQRRGFDFDITIDDAWQLFLDQGKRCTLTGLPLVMNPTDLRAGKSTASLDRIDSSKGYVIGNVQWIHITINLMKQTLPVDEFIHWCRLVATHGSESLPDRS